MTDFRSRTCCFTGHRDIPPAELPKIKAHTKQAIRRLIADGVIYYGVGGAIGFDTLAAEVLFELRSTESPEIRVILVYPFEGFTSRWREAQKALYAELLPKYDKVVCVCKTPSKGAYLVRDRHLVDGSSHCICYLTRCTGGTAYTVDYARQHGLDIYNVAMK